MSEKLDTLDYIKATLGLMLMVGFLVGVLTGMIAVFGAVLETEWYRLWSAIAASFWLMFVAAFLAI